MELKNLFKRQTVWLFLDGVDEINDDQSPLYIVEKCLEEVERWIVEAHRIKVLLSCRVNIWGVENNCLLTLAVPFIAYQSNKFSYPEQVNEFITKWFTKQNKLTLGQKLIDNLRRREYQNIQELIQHPFRLFTLCFYWQKTEKMLENNIEIYESFINLLYVWKQENSQYLGTKDDQQDELYKKLSELALAAIQNNQNPFYISSKLVSNYLGMANNPLFKSALNISFLNCSDYPNSLNKFYRFSDPTLHEYFAATAIKDKKDILNSEKFTYHVFEKKWQDVILFWLDLPSNKQKNQFFRELIDFKDEFTNDNFYEYRVYFFLMKIMLNKAFEQHQSLIINQVARWGFQEPNILEVIRDEARLVLGTIDDSLILRNIREEKLRLELSQYFDDLKNCFKKNCRGLQKENVDPNFSDQEILKLMKDLIGNSVNSLVDKIEEEQFEQILDFLTTFEGQDQEVIRKNLLWKITQYLSPFDFCDIFNNKNGSSISKEKPKLEETNPMNTPGFPQRLQHLEDNINEELALQKEYEDELRYEDDPKRKRKYRQRIDEQKETITQYQQEYNQLNQESTTRPPQLQQVEDKLNLLLEGQAATYLLLRETRETLLARYEVSERAIIDNLTQTFQESQIQLTQILLDAVDTNQVSDTQMQQMLAVIEAKLPALPASQSEPIAEIVKNPELDFRHRLKVALPIVPFLVDYEAEMELGTGFNIKETWEWLRKKLQAK